MTSVLIADDRALVRVGLRKILDAEPETIVVGGAEDGEDAVAEAGRLRPDVVLMGIRSRCWMGSRRPDASSGRVPRRVSSS